MVIDTNVIDAVGWLRLQYDRICGFWPLGQAVELEFGPYYNFLGQYTPFFMSGPFIRLSTLSCRPFYRGLATFVLLHEYRHAQQDAQVRFTKQTIRAYEQHKKFYLKIERDADQWAKEAFNSMFASELEPMEVKAAEEYINLQQEEYQGIENGLRRKSGFRTCTHV